MTRFKAEVRDVGGCGVGTSVLVTKTMERAMSFVSVTLKEKWAGEWSIEEMPDTEESEL